MLLKKYIWTNELCIGIAKIDEQHKLLVTLLSRLGAVLENNTGQVNFDEIIFHLQNYATVHFRTELEYMEPHKADISNYDRHIMEHEAFVEELGKLLSDGGDYLKIGYGLHNFLGDWLVSHITETDAIMAKALHYKGVHISTC